MLLALILAAELVTSDQLFDPAWRGREVSVEGVVHEAGTNSVGTLTLSIFRTVASFSATIPNGSGAFGDRALPVPLSIVDARVRVTGTLEAMMSEDGVLAGVVVRGKSPKDLEILEPAPKHPFDTPLDDPEDLENLEDPARRVHLKGIVIFSRPKYDKVFKFLPEGGTVMSVELARRSQMPEKGDVVEVVGFCNPVSAIPVLSDARCEVREKGAGSGEQGAGVDRVPPPLEMSIANIVKLPLYGQNVVVSGRIADFNRRAQFLQLHLTDGEHRLNCVVPYDESEDTPDWCRLGAVVQVTGNVSYYVQRGMLLTENPMRENLTVHAASFDDLVVLKGAPFWTVRRVWYLLIGTLFGAAFLVWAVRQHEKTKAEAVRRERLRFSHDLHDNMQQLLASAAFRLDAVKSLWDYDDKAAREQLAGAAKTVTHTQAGLRAILWGLQEESEGPESLYGLLEYAAGRMAHWQGVVEIESAGSEPPTARRAGGSLLMILCEAVGNALKHGRAEHVDVKLAFPTGRIVMRITDDGCGFDVSAPREGIHLGLTSMQSRAAELGGTLAVHSTPGTGTTVTVDVPVC